LKALALVEIDNETGLCIGKPIEIFAKNATLEKLNVYFSDCERLINAERQKSQIQKRDETLLQAEINRFSAMGFIHISNYKILVHEAVNEERRRVLLEKILKPLKDLKFTILKAIGGFFINKLKNK
jgi:hypothetical protein